MEEEKKEFGHGCKFKGLMFDAKCMNPENEHYRKGNSCDEKFCPDRDCDPKKEEGKKSYKPKRNKKRRTKRKPKTKKEEPRKEEIQPKEEPQTQSKEETTGLHDESNESGLPKDKE